MPGCEAVKSFKDPVHGYVDLCRGPARVVDDWVMQRLRGIRQTGFAYLVYHGMEHSRFNHSLGAAHLAREVLGFLASNTASYYPRGSGAAVAGQLLRASEVFQLAALVHDIGHMPFSHSSEAALRDARLLYGGEIEGIERLPVEHGHEAYTYSLLGHVAAVAEEAGVEPVFTEGLESDLRFILQGAGNGEAETSGDEVSDCVTSILHQLIAGGLDVDRMDYLIRDSIYAGVRYGVFDVDRLVRVLIATPLLRGGGGCSIAVLDKGVSVVESFLLSRFYMFSEVYLHRVVEAYNSVYARLVAVLARDGLVCVQGAGDGARCRVEVPEPEMLARGDEDALKTWRILDDYTVMSLVRRVADGAEKASPEAVKLAGMLTSRRHPRLYRVVESKKLWSAVKQYMKSGVAPEEIKGILEEIIEIQRRDPLVIVRPLQVDIVSVSRILVYNRSNRRVESLEETGATTARRLRRLAQRSEELGLYRVAVFAPDEEGHRELAEKAYNLLKEAARLADGGEPGVG